MPPDRPNCSWLVILILYYALFLPCFPLCISRISPRPYYYYLLAMLRAFAIPIALIALLIPSLVQAVQPCYYYDGDQTPNNTVCSGSLACCGDTATCTQNRLCHNPGDPPSVFVRGPCADKTWDSSLCPQICLYGEFAFREAVGRLALTWLPDESDGVFPRVKQCNDTSWCCYSITSPAGISAADTCCRNGAGVFLDSTGNVISGPASSSSSRMSATPTSIHSVAKASLSATPTSTLNVTSTTHDSGLSTGAKAGIGVGVGVGALLVVATGLIIWLLARRRKNNAASSTSSHTHEKDANLPVYAHYADQTTQPSQPPEPPAEVVGSMPGHRHNDAGRVEAEDRPQSPRELPGDGIRAEDRDEK